MPEISSIVVDLFRDLPGRKNSWRVTRLPRARRVHTAFIDLPVDHALLASRCWSSCMVYTPTILSDKPPRSLPCGTDSWNTWSIPSAYRKGSYFGRPYAPADGLAQNSG